jgi:hypothetical protein
MNSNIKNKRKVSLRTRILILCAFVCGVGSLIPYFFWEVLTARIIFAVLLGITIILLLAFAISFRVDLAMRKSDSIEPKLDD